MSKQKHDKNLITDESLTYLKHICNNDFYQNDREFIDIIKKLTKQTASMGNKALGLVNILNEAERLKLEMVQKEIDLGLDEKEKPYGLKRIEDITNTSLYYKSNSSKKKLIELFISYLENYFSIENTEKRREILINAKALVDTLRSSGEEPKHFIINRQREKTWFILESNFAKTLRQFDIDLFIEKIRLTRLQYQNDFDEMKQYQGVRKSAIKKIMHARETNDQNTIDQLQDIIDNGPDVEIKPLLIDTQKVMDSLNFMLEDLPSELNNDQTNELQQFIPAISEYYQDQCYRISGGYAHTPLAKNLHDFQKVIEKNSSVSVLLDKVKELDQTMQHLYILHWIGETLLKEILKNGKSMGVNIRLYNEKFSTKVKLVDIRKAVLIRNNIAHNGLIWNPEEISYAINAYREYIEKIAKEQKIDLKKFKLPKHNQQITKADKLRYHKEFFSGQLAIDKEELEKLDPEYVKTLEQTLEKQNWTLNNNDKNMIVSKIKKMTQNDFSNKLFGLSMKEIADKLFAHEKQLNKSFDPDDSEQRRSVTKSLYWLYYNQTHENAKAVEKQIKKKIGV